MRFTVRYIPLSKIKPDFSVRMTQHIRLLRKVMLDCMHLLVVRKNRKDGSFIVLSGHDRLEFLRKHTRKLTAPCLVDESGSAAKAESWLHRLRNRRALKHFPLMKPDRLTPASWAILREFLREEPRFKRLSRTQQLKVLVLAARYKRTVVVSMKAKVDDLLSDYK